MSAQTDQQISVAERAVRALYHQMLESWNQRNAAAMAALYVEDCHLIGFDGSQIDGRAQIEAEIGQIFADHQTGAYVGKVRAVSFLRPDVAILRAVVGMVPPGQTDIKPDVNAIQTMVATEKANEWRITLFQNTPAQFHGRPELIQALSEELRQLL